MTDVSVKMIKPFPIDESVFRGVLQHGYCDLHVPVGSKIRYAAMEVWKEFAVIVEDAGTGQKKGDLNGDGNVTIADGVAVLNAMAGETVSGDPDVNGDGGVTIADFVAVLNIMAEQ
jgi:hypothetical protein